MADERLQEYLLRDEPRGTGRWLMRLVNPFTVVAGVPALGIGAAIVAATAALAAAGEIHFDGFLDMHISPVVAPAWLYALQPVADWLTAAVVFWLAGMALSRSKQRVIDYFGTTAVARFPYLIAAIAWQRPLLGGAVEPLVKTMASGGLTAQKIQAVPGLPWVVLGAVVTLVLLLWLLFMCYFALKESSGMQWPRAVPVFIGAVIVAEIVSKLVVFALARSAGAL
jgi:hypothetical protein